MSEQTTIQKLEKKTRETITKTREGIQNLLDKMRQSRLGLDEPEEKHEDPEDDEWNYE